MVLKSCCGCGHLKTGVMIIAILHLISWSLCFLALLYTVIVAATVTIPDESENLMTILHSISVIILSYLLLPVFIELVISVCFIYGVAKEKKYFILPVLITEIIELIVGTVCLITNAVTAEEFENLGYLLFIGFGAYIWYCNYSFYKMLSIRGNDAQFYSKMPTDRSFILTEKV